jgi:hydrogenase maturation protein HypF
MEQRCLTVVVRGTVQGVGFRPFVYRSARRWNIRGSVRNTSDGVEIAACGTFAAIEGFLDMLRLSSPPLASITNMEISEEPDIPGTGGFSILPSLLGDESQVDAARDTAVCDACLSEMRDSSNRRYRHPFITCTDCGPRYSIIRALPYDRDRTTMAHFTMCAGCHAEFHDPEDRRFHAQPVCCPACGPRLALLDATAAAIDVHDPIAAAVVMLAEGTILAIKGIGGFHLACRADHAAAVAELRRRKHRAEKPLAIMVRDIGVARAYAEVSEIEAALLRGVERPIVLLLKKPNPTASITSRIAPEVAPHVHTLGVMLPYAPLHHLLFDTDRYDALVMTSANPSGEPLCISTEEAVATLAGIADGYLTHDRPIQVRLDDSIARVLDGAPLLVRRGRGYAPAPLPAGTEVDGVVALGGIMKSTVAVGRGRTCYVSQYLGSSENLPTIDNCEQSLRHLLGLLGVTPAQYACDLHPGGLNKALVGSPNLPLIKVQHHYAHAVACMAENRLQGKAVCVVYDGMGLGDDGAIWGGEVLIADRRGYERVGWWDVGPMPGGDAATFFPGRMLMGALWQRQGEGVMNLCPWMAPEEGRATMELLAADINCPRTSSMGRLFDACAALLDVCRRQTYEGQPAVELEGAADPAEEGSIDVQIREMAGSMVADGAGLLLDVRGALRQGASVARAAALFHNAVADATVRIAMRAAVAARLDSVCLSGGCFLNKLLCERTVAGLRAAGLRPVVHRILPPGDECVAFGQAIVAAEQRRTQGIL